MEKAAGLVCAKRSAWSCESEPHQMGACAMQPGRVSTLQADMPMGTRQGLWAPRPGLCAIGGGASTALFLSRAGMGCFPELVGSREELVEVPKLPALLRWDEFTFQGHR